MKEREASYRAVVEDQMDYIVRWYPDGTRLFVNESYSDYWQKPSEDLIGTSIFNEENQEDKEFVLNIVKALSPENPVITQEHFAITPAGDLRWHVWTDRGIFDDEGDLLIIQSVGRDIHERKLAEQELQAAHQELETAYDSTLEGWAKALEFRDKDTQDHSRSVVELTLMLAEKLGVPKPEMEHLRRGALLHDIGKMAIPNSILQKTGPLTEEEEKVMQMHPLHAHDLLAGIDFLEPAMAIPCCHHEKWDGTGYPYGMQGEEIPLHARIFSVVDVWDALLSARSYREAWTEPRAREYIEEQSGKQFDPLVVKNFFELVEDNQVSSLVRQ